MEDSNLKEYFINLQACFLQGDLERLEDFFAFPLVVYTLAGVIVIRDSGDFGRLVEQYRAALIALDVAKSDVKVDTESEPRNNRRQVIVRMQDLDANGSIVTGSLIRYFLVDQGKMRRIEMMEYLESPLPKEDVERIVH